ncbi:hypothetical protein AgCh_007858 [Apium graveolens]
MLLFIKMANSLYVQILKNGPFTPMERVEKSTDGDMVIPAHYAPKDPSKYSEIEKEKVSLDSGLQLILIESLDNVMYNNIINCDTSKQIWEKIEILYEGTEEVRSNQRRILIYDKYYESEEVNLKFLLTLPDHLEQKISAIREGRDLNRMTQEVLYGILKTYELEMIQRKSFRDGQGHLVDGSSALVVNDRQSSDDELEIQLLQLMSKRTRNHISKCFNYDKLGHFATECRKPNKVKKDKAYLELEEKYEALLRKQQGKAYIAEGRSWDDSDNDDDEEVRNYARMALEQGESSSSKTQVPTLTTIDLNESQYKETIEKMIIEMFHIHLRRQENEYLMNKLKCASEIEVVLREKIEKNEVEGDRGKTIIDKDAPVMLRKVDAPLFKECEANFSEVELVIKQELADEDNEIKCTETTSTPKAEKKPMVNQTPKKPIKEVKAENAGTKKKNRNGKVVSKPGMVACKYNETKADDPYSICDMFDCIPCNIKVMTSCHKLRIDLNEVNIKSSAKKENAHQLMNFILSESSNSTSTKSGKMKNVIWIIDSGCLKYMIGNMALLSQFEEMAGPLVTFEDNINGFTMGYGKIIYGNIVIEDVVLVAGLEAFEEQSKPWHIKLSHLNYKAINTLVKKELVRDMPNLKFAQNEVFEACQKGKMKKSSHKINVLSISRKKFALVMVDDYSRYTWVKFMHSKDETPHIIIEHIKKIEKQAEGHECVKRLRSDNGTEFRNTTLTDFCKDKGIVQEFSAARKPQQNGVVERKNRTQLEAARTMLHDAKWPTSF